MMKVLCQSDRAQDGADNTAGTQPFRRKISKQFRINVDRTDCDLKVCGLAHKNRSILSIRQQRRNRLARRRWQTHHNALRIHLSASHAPICRGGRGMRGLGQESEAC